jgi:hypothetical protein
LRTTEKPVATAADTLAAWPMQVPVVMGRMPKGAE